MLRRDWAITQVQERDGDRSGVIEDVYAFLVGRLWGTGADPETGAAVADEFEGSQHARGRAVIELSERWTPIAAFLDRYLQRRFDESFAVAIARTPAWARLVTDAEEIRRLPTPALRHGHRMRSTRAGDVISTGDWRGDRHFIDVRRELTDGRPRIDNPGEFWFSLRDQALWFYVGTSLLDQRSAGDLAKDAVVQVFLNRVMEFAFGSAARTRSLGRMGLLESRAADALRREIASAEGPGLAAAIEGGAARPVEDSALLTQGYHTEVEVVSEGQRHVYRVRGHGPDARWCRFSDLPLCSLERPGAVADALARAPTDSRLAGGLGGLAEAPDAAAGAAVRSQARVRLPAHVEAAAYYQGERLGVSGRAVPRAPDRPPGARGPLGRPVQARARRAGRRLRRGEKLAARVRRPVPEPRVRRPRPKDREEAPAAPAAQPTPVQPPRPALTVTGGADPRTAGLGQIRSISRRMTAQGEEEVTIDGYLAEGIKQRPVNAPNSNLDPIWDQLRAAYGLEGWEAAHLWGPGFGDEAPAEAEATAVRGCQRPRNPSRKGGRRSHRGCRCVGRRPLTCDVVGDLRRLYGRRGPSHSRRLACSSCRCLAPRSRP